MSDTNFTAKTFFNVIHEKSLENMGIKPTWDNLELLKANLEVAYNEIGGTYYSSICKSKDGVMHIHNAVTFESAKRLKAVSRLLGNCHVEPMRGSKEQAIDYVEKKPPYTEKGEEVLLVFGNKEGIQNNRGARNDLKNFDEIALKEGFNLNNYILDNCLSDKECSFLEHRYQRLLRREAKAWRNVEVIYVEGKAGSGKTRVAMETYPYAFRVDVSTKSSFPFNGYSGEKVLILDELRPGIFSHSELMQILDGYKYNINIKYGQITAMWEKVIIASAMPLKDWYTDKEDIKGQDNRREQFMRRISKHLIAKEGQWYDYIEEEEHWEKATEEENNIFNLTLAL